MTTIIKPKLFALSFVLFLCYLNLTMQQNNAFDRENQNDAVNKACLEINEKKKKEKEKKKSKFGHLY